MSVERQLVEKYVGDAISKARELSGPPRERDVARFWTYMGAAVVYALGEIDNDLWFMIESINKEVADNAIILGETPDDLSSISSAELAEMSSDEVRTRISDQLNCAEQILSDSADLTDGDKATMSIAFLMGKALVLQLRELNDDECHLTSAIEKGSSTLAQLLNRR